MLLGYGVAGLGIDKKLRMRYVFSFLIYLLIVALSATRTNIIVFSFLPFLIFFFGKKHFRFRRFLTLIILAPFFMVASLTINPKVFDRWEQRFSAYTENDTDFTTQARLDETRGKFKLLQEDVWPFFLGRGWGWANNKPESFYVTQYADGEHNFFFTPIFHSGIFFGLFMFCFIPSVIFRGVRNFSQQIYSSKDLVFYWTFVIAALSYFCLIFTSNPFGDRFSGALFGVVAGLLCWPRSKQG